MKGRGTGGGMSISSRYFVAGILWTVAGWTWMAFKHPEMALIDFAVAGALIAFSIHLEGEGK